MATGTVKVWSKGNGFGWIQPDSGGDRVYVHKSGVERRDPDRAAYLAPGEKVEYQIGQRPKGTAAINVKLVTDTPAAAPVATADESASSADAS
jgi:CspA family cold shock protein